MTTLSGKVKQSVLLACPSICFHSYFFAPTKLWTRFCMWGHDRSWPGIESRGQRSVSST